MLWRGARHWQSNKTLDDSEFRRLRGLWSNAPWKLIYNGPGAAAGRDAAGMQYYALHNKPGPRAFESRSLCGIPGAPIYAAASDSSSEAARVTCPVQVPLDTPGHAADSVEPMQQPMPWTPVTDMTTAAGIQPPGQPTFVFGAMGGGSLCGIPGAPVHVAASKAARVAGPGQGLQDSTDPSATATLRRRGRPPGPPRLLNGLSTTSPTTPTTPGAGILPLQKINDLMLHNCVNDLVLHNCLRHALNTQGGNDRAAWRAMKLQRRRQDLAGTLNIVVRAVTRPWSWYGSRRAQLLSF